MTKAYNYIPNAYLCMPLAYNINLSQKENIDFYMLNAYNCMRNTYRGGKGLRELTKNKIKLLRLFFEHPERSFYMHEIGRLIGKKPGVFQKTLYGMEGAGIVLSEYKANARYFKVNREYPIYNELKSIVYKMSGKNAKKYFS